MREAIAAEKAAKHEMLRLSRQLREVERLEARQAYRARTDAIGAAVRAETVQRTGRDLLAAVQSVPKASDDEVRTLSERLNSCLVSRTVDGKPSWYHFYRQLDEDNTGRISFAELKRAVRQLLQIGADTVPDAVLRSIWRNLDEDGNGFLTAGEFGRFMRKGESAAAAAAAAAAAKGKAQTETASQAHRVELDGLMGKAWTRKLLEQGTTKADDDDVLAISAIFNRELAKLPPTAREWYHLFKVFDEDGTGRVTYAQLERALRNDLRVSKAALPDAKLHELWLTLDDDEDGAVEAGEFGRFMKRAAKLGGGVSTASEGAAVGRPAKKLQLARASDQDMDREVRRAHVRMCGGAGHDVHARTCACACASAHA